VPRLPSRAPQNSDALNAVPASAGASDADTRASSISARLVDSGGHDMGGVIAIIRVMPESVDVDLEQLKKTIRQEIPAIQDIAEEPIAFGLKALKVAAIVGDDEGGTEPLELALAAIDGVASAETIDLNRML
jgi:elongation factor 1-beta